MADLETMHRIVEKLELTGEKEAMQKMGLTARVVEKLTKALGYSEKEGKGVSDVLGDINVKAKTGADEFKKLGDSAEEGGTKSSGWLGSLTGGLTKGLVVANLLTGAVTWLVDKVRQLATAWWDVNKGTEAMAGRIQGVALGMLDLSKHANKVATTQKLTNILMAEFRDHAIRIGVDIPDLEAAYTRINSVMSAMGKNQLDVLNTTKLTASAAKVYGERLEMAGSIISKAMIEGTVEGESGFAKAFKAQVGAMPGKGFNKLPIEKRAKRIEKVLREMAKPIDVITTDTESALQRWKVLSEDVLQRVTYPLYKKIGGVVQDIVNYLEKNKSTIDSIVDSAVHWFNIFWDLGASVAEILYGITKWGAKSSIALNSFKALGQIASLFVKTIGAAAAGFKLLIEQVKIAVDPNRQFGKMNALVEGMKFKFIEIMKIVKDLGFSIIKIFGGDKVVAALKKSGRAKWLTDWVDGLKKSNREMDDNIARWEKKLAKMEKAAGLSPTTEFGQKQELEELGIGMDKDARLAWLKKLFGKKRPLINVQNMNVRQDFRDMDPDNVMIEMVRLYENLAEEALSSNIGGEESVFAGGS